MAQVFGSISEFSYNAESFTEWVERLEQWFIANDITTAAKKRALFLSNIGARGYKLVRSLSQNEPTNKSYDELKKLMLDHIHPKPNEIAQRYVFYKRDRRSGESVKDYVAELRKLSEHCKFADNLEDNLRDKFVCGLNDEKVQQKLLATANLTLQSAVDTATAMEAAARSAKQIHSSSAVSDVHKLGQQRFQRGKGHQGGGKFQGNGGDSDECNRCGSHEHLADSCPFKNRSCHRCKKFGHSKYKCKNFNAGPQDGRRPTGRVNWEGAEELNEVELREEMDLVEGGMNFVSLYRLSEVSDDEAEAEVHKKVEIDSPEDDNAEEQEENLWVSEEDIEIDELMKKQLKDEIEGENEVENSVV